jgi:hypothetical protein
MSVHRRTQAQRDPLADFVYRAVTVYGRPFQSRSTIRAGWSDAWPSTPVCHGFGLLRVRSPLLAECCLFLGVLRCFSSPGSPPRTMRSFWVAQACPWAGFPIRISPAIAVAHTLPRLFAVYHVLRRHKIPRHPPYALVRFLHLTAAGLACSRIG